MAFGVFIHRSDSIYDDSPAERYQFPRQYLRRVEACVGDWIVYYEPRKVVATRGYFSVAKISQIVPDPTARDMFLALIEPGSYLDFADPVPFNLPDGVVERGLLNEQGVISGRRNLLCDRSAPPTSTASCSLAWAKVNRCCRASTILRGRAGRRNRRHFNWSRPVIASITLVLGLCVTVFSDKSFYERMTSDAP